MILWVLHTSAPSDSFGLGSTLHGIGKSGNTADTVGTGMSRKFGAQDDLMTGYGIAERLGGCRGIRAAVVAYKADRLQLLNG